MDTDALRHAHATCSAAEQVYCEAALAYSRAAVECAAEGISWRQACIAGVLDNERYHRKVAADLAMKAAHEAMVTAANAVDEAENHWDAEVARGR